MSYFHDSDFQEKLLVPYCRDRNFLKQMSGILSPEDFKPKRGEGMIEAYWIGKLAAKYWKDYRQPIGGMLKTEVLDYIRENKKKIGSKSRERLLDLTQSISKANGMVPVEAITKKVIDYKRRQQMKHAVSDLIDHQEAGTLTPERWLKIARKAVDFVDYELKISDFTAKDAVEKRVKRREKDSSKTYPYFMIDPLDQEIRTIPRGEYFLILGKYKLGKSTAAIHIAQAFALQDFNVLLFSFEDPAEMVEDRLDSFFTGIPMKRLIDKSSKLKRRMRRRLDNIRGKIRVVDASEGMTVQRVEELWEQFRNQGFNADLVILEGDENITPGEHFKGDSGERRESMENHKTFKRFCAKKMVWGCITAQTQRGKSGARKMVITGDDAAIDISKVRRAALTLGIGDGPEAFGDDGRYIFVAAHRYDKSRIGWPIKGDFKRATFYSKEMTEEAVKDYEKEKGKND